MYNAVDVDLMRTEHRRRHEELTRPVRPAALPDRRERRLPVLPVLPGRLGPVLAVLLHREPHPRRRPA